MRGRGQAGPWSFIRTRTWTGKRIARQPWYLIYFKMLLPQSQAQTQVQADFCAAQMKSTHWGKNTKLLRWVELNSSVSHNWRIDVDVGHSRKLLQMIANNRSLPHRRVDCWVGRVLGMGLKLGLGFNQVHQRSRTQKQERGTDTETETQTRCVCSVWSSVALRNEMRLATAVALDSRPYWNLVTGTGNCIGTRRLLLQLKLHWFLD